MGSLAKVQCVCVFVCANKHGVVWSGIDCVQWVLLEF